MDRGSKFRDLLWATSTVTHFQNQVRGRELLHTHRHRKSMECAELIIFVFVLNLENDLWRSFKGVVNDTEESLLIFELNSQTNIPLPSVLLQTHASNAQH